MHHAPRKYSEPFYRSGNTVNNFTHPLCEAVSIHACYRILLY